MASDSSAFCSVRIPLKLLVSLKENYLPSLYHLLRLCLQSKCRYLHGEVIKQTGQDNNCSLWNLTEFSCASGEVVREADERKRI